LDPLQFFTASRLVVVAGKGGVGKTTVSAVMARAAADCGLRVLAVELEGKAALGELLGGDGPLPVDEVTLAEGLGPAGTGTIRARTLTASSALTEYLDTHGLRRVSKRLVTTGIVDLVATAAPGVDDLLVLGKLKQIERGAPDIDLVVVDGPAAGHAITFLMAPAGLADAAASGPINTQARDVLEMLGDSARCQVLLVTLPETTPVNELIETAEALENRVGVHLGPVVVNGVDLGDDVPDPHDVPAGELPKGRDGTALREAARFRNQRRARQHQELDRLGGRLALPLLRLPLIATAGITAGDVVDVAAALTDEIRGLDG
jgi:anion-transporting  ArsA/GET3 family ATPase